jgi:hypothetical protein
MSYVKHWSVTLLALVALCAVPGAARAAVIFYEATDLADLVSGQDLWQYRYEVTGITFDANEGFAIYASDSLYQELVSPGPVNADWDATVFQPDVVLNSPGAFDALAKVAGASLADPFIMNFVWLGGTRTPGSQPFEIYRLIDEQLTVIDEGRTIPRTTPEPATGLLLGLAALGAAFWRRRS